MKIDIEIEGALLFTQVAGNR